VSLLGKASSVRLRYSTVKCRIGRDTTAQNGRCRQYGNLFVFADDSDESSYMSTVLKQYSSPKTRSPQNHYPHPNVFLTSCPSCQQPLIPTCEPDASISSPPACPAPGVVCIRPPHARLPPNRPRCTSSVLFCVPNPSPGSPLPDCPPLCPNLSCRGFLAHKSRRRGALPSSLCQAPRALPSLSPSSRPTRPRSTIPHIVPHPLPFFRITMCGYRCFHIGTFCSMPPTSSSVLLRVADHFHDAVPGAVGAGHGVRERAHDLHALGTGTTCCLPHPSIRDGGSQNP
jgi:hypothetical protein